MKPSIKRLRTAYSEYMSAKQARYDELTDWNPYDDDALEKHKVVSARISMEESAILIEDERLIYQISIGPYIHEDMLYASNYSSDSKEPLFDLT